MHKILFFEEFRLREHVSIFCTINLYFLYFNDIAKKEHKISIKVPTNKTLKFYAHHFLPHHSKSQSTYNYDTILLETFTKDSSLINLLTVCALALFTSLILSRLIINFLGQRLLDTPNHRSSHQTPTPRGGGIALVCGVIASSLLAWHFGLIITVTTYWLLLLSVLMALLGTCDDLLNLKVGIRLITQVLLSASGALIIGIDTELPTGMQLLAGHRRYPVVPLVLIVITASKLLP